MKKRNNLTIIRLIMEYQEAYIIDNFLYLTFVL